jgi:lysophospholipase L1-like esterase
VRQRLWQNIALGLAGLLAGLLLLELGCRLYAVRIYRGFEAMRSDPRHYLRASPDPALAYELSPGSYQDAEAGRQLAINRFGLREESDEIPRVHPRIGVLGDSVVFGIGHSQERTIPKLLEARLRRSGGEAAVLNLGVGGYGLAELVAFLRAKDAIYDLDAVIYLLNPNDFARRESIYEGADNGLYRMYVRPTLMAPWFVRKAIYRYHKQGNSSVGWYEWLFAGSREIGFGQLAALQDYAGAQGIDLRVVLLPAGVAYRNGEYLLSRMHGEIGAFLASRGIPYRDAAEEFGREHERYFDATDHLVDAGNVLMADLMAQLLEQPRASRS